jgi:hypothetical protein
MSIILLKNYKTFQIRLTFLYFFLKMRTRTIEPKNHRNEVVASLRWFYMED